MNKVVKTQAPPILALEEQEADVWREYRQANREHNRLERMGFKDGAKRARKRALLLNRRHTQVMHKILLAQREAVFGSVRRGS